MLLQLFLLTVGVFSSANKDYYVCNTNIDSPYCVFEFTSEAPTVWGSEPVYHDVEESRSGAYGTRQVVDIEGSPLNVAPAPWKNGDYMKDTDVTGISGDLWNYALAFEMVAPVRDLLMFEPRSLDTDEMWNKYTKVFSDCGIKQDDAENEHGMAEATTDDVRAWLGNPGSPASINTGLQYLEEAAIDLVCLMTDLDGMSRCDTIREYVGIELGVRCDCWMDAYEELYGTPAEIDSDPTHQFSTCTIPDPPASSDDGTTGDDTTPTGPTCCDGSVATTNESGPPTCDNGDNALAPGELCPDDDTSDTETTEAAGDDDDNSTDPTQTTGDDDDDASGNGTGTDDYATELCLVLAVLLTTLNY